MSFQDFSLDTVFNATYGIINEKRRIFNILAYNENLLMMVKLRKKVVRHFMNWYYLGAMATIKLSLPKSM